MRDGDLGRHARKTRRIYHARRDHLAMLLREHLADHLSFSLPAGGLALWARLATGQDAELWSNAAERLGLSVTPAVKMCVDVAAAPQALRLGFGNLDEREIARAVDLLTRAGRATSRR